MLAFCLFVVLEIVLVNTSFSAVDARLAAVFLQALLLEIRMLQGFLGGDAVVRVDFEQLVQQIVHAVREVVLGKVPVRVGMLAETLVQPLLAVVAAVGKRGRRLFRFQLAGTETSEAEPETHAKLTQIQRLLALARLDVATELNRGFLDALITKHGDNLGQRVKIIRILEERVAPRKNAQQHDAGRPDVDDGRLVRVLEQHLRWTVSGSTGSGRLHLLLHEADVAHLALAEAFAQSGGTGSGGHLRWDRYARRLGIACYSLLLLQQLLLALSNLNVSTNAQNSRLDLAYQRRTVEILGDIRELHR